MEHDSYVSCSMFDCVLHFALCTLYYAPMPNYDRLSILVSLVLLGLALTFLIDLPTRTLDAEILGSPVRLEVSSRVIMALLLTALTAVGVEYIMRAHPNFGTDVGTDTERVGGYSFLFWILPTLVTLAATWFTPGLFFNNGLLAWVAGLGVAAVLLSGIILAEYRTIVRDDPFYTTSRLFLNICTYFAALLIFATVYQAKLRSLLSATMVAVLATVLALSLLRADREKIGRTWLYAGITGLVLGEATWALNYWGVNGVAGGALLLLIFYFFGGLAQQRLTSRFSRPALVEYALVGVVGLYVLATNGALTW